MLLHQSDLKSWARCPQQWYLGQQGYPRRQLSATAYGSVMHHALHVYERSGDLHAALETFAYYWHPHHIEAICEPVDIWLPRQSYSELRARGLEAIRRYADLLRYDEHELLALEFEFVVPVHGTHDPATGGPHHLGGTVDRLALRHVKRALTVCIDDFKTGKRPSYLRHDIQGTAYAYASLQPEFWHGSNEWNTEGFGPERGAELAARVTNAARKFTWIDLTKFALADGGFRGERDYARLRLAVQQVADSIAAGIHPLSITGEYCEHCPFREVCGGVGLDDAAGDPR